MELKDPDLKSPVWDFGGGSWPRNWNRWSRIYIGSSKIDMRPLYCVAATSWWPSMQAVLTLASFLTIGPGCSHYDCPISRIIWSLFRLAIFVLSPLVLVAQRVDTLPEMDTCTLQPKVWIQHCPLTSMKSEPSSSQSVSHLTTMA